MGWTLQGSKVVGSGPQVRAEIDASDYTNKTFGDSRPHHIVKRTVRVHQHSMTGRICGIGE